MNQNGKYYSINSGDELKHYGVLGMRWGVRHDKQYEKTRMSLDKKLKSGSIKKKEYKKQLANERVKVANRLYSRNSKETNKRIMTRSMGKNIARSILLGGSYGAMRYDQYVGKTKYAKNRATAYLKSVGWNALNASLNPLALPGTGLIGLYDYGKNVLERPNVKQKRQNVKNTYGI